MRFSLRWLFGVTSFVAVAPHDVSVFHEVGHMLATFLAEFVGGMVALLRHGHRTQRRPAPIRGWDFLGRLTTFWAKETF